MFKSCSCCNKLFHAENLNKFDRCEQCEFKILADIENQLEQENRSDIDIVAALSQNPNYRSDFNAHLANLKKLYGMEDLP